MDLAQLQPLVEAAYEDRSLLEQKDSVDAVQETIHRLDAGEIRVAEKSEDGSWTVHAWIKQAILLYFGVQQMETIEVGPFEYFDKIPIKHGWEAAGVRVVPPATVRRGAFVERGAVLMPSYVNIGAYVGTGTMVDTWATVGS